MDVTTTLQVDRPPGEVFDFVADMTNAPSWQRDLQEVRRITAGPLRAGSEHEFVRRFAGRTVASRNRFVTFEPGRFVAFEIPAGWIRGTASYRVEPDGTGGTLLSSRMQLHIVGWAAFLEPALARLLARDSRRDEGKLKEVLESRSVATSP